MIATLDVVEPPSLLRWSRAKLVGFRLAFAIVVLSSPQLLTFSSNYLVVQSLNRPLQAALAPLAGVELQSGANIGAFVVLPAARDPQPRPSTSSSRDFLREGLLRGTSGIGTESPRVERTGIRGGDKPWRSDWR
jgi:hypothetical protein